MTTKNADSLREKRVASTETDEKTSSDPQMTAIDAFAKALLDKLGLDQAKGSVLFKNAHIPFSEKPCMSLPDLMKFAVAKGNVGGHRYSKWYKCTPAKFSSHLTQREHNYYTKCVQCKGELYVRIDPPPVQAGGVHIAKENTSVVHGRTIEKSCMQLQRKKSGSQMPNEFASIANV